MVDTVSSWPPGTVREEQPSLGVESSMALSSSSPAIAVPLLRRFVRGMICATAVITLSLHWQRMLSIGPDSTKDGDQDSSEDKGQSKDHSKDGRGAGGKSGMGGSAGEGNIPPAGRGRGAFSQFLRTHEVSVPYVSNSLR